MKYRKKSVVIDAYKTYKEVDIKTLEGTMHANVGDWIITGVNGEVYPCKPDIFEKTYEEDDGIYRDQDGNRLYTEEEVYKVIHGMEIEYGLSYGNDLIEDYVS